MNGINENGYWKGGVDNSGTDLNETQMDETYLTLFSFFNVLNVLSGVDEIVQPASQLFTEINQEFSQQPSNDSLKDIILAKIELLKKEEHDLLEQVEVQQHAKQTLMKELENIDKQIEKLQARKRSNTISLKCAKAAMTYLSEQLSTKKLASVQNQDRSIEKRLLSFIWFLDNTHVATEQQIKNALTEFCTFSMNSDEVMDNHQELWIKIIEGLLVMLNKTRPDFQVLILRILLELSRNGANTRTIKEKDGFEIVIGLLKSINDEVNGEACSCITLFSNSTENKKLLGEKGASKALIALLQRSRSIFSLERALVALWHLSIEDRNKVIIGEEGGIEALCSFLNNPHEGILENSLIALGYLTRNDQNKMLIREIGGLEYLIELLSHPKEHIQAKSAGSLWNCASDIQNKSVIRKLGGIKKLVALLDSTNETVLENVTGALWNCVVDDENKKEVLICHGIPKLVTLLSSCNEALLENVTGTLWNCTSLSDIKILLRKTNGLHALINLLDSNNETILENSVGAIRNCAINDQNKRAINELGGIEILIKLLDNIKKLSILEKIVSTLWICSIDEINKRVIKEKGAFPKLIELLSHPSPSIIEKSLGTLRNCSAIPENKVELRNCGGIPKLVRLLGPNYPPSIREYSAATLGDILYRKHP
jgi:hypothetical protein